MPLPVIAYFALSTAAAYVAPKVTKYLAKKSLDDRTERDLNRSDVKSVISNVRQTQNNNAPGITIGGTKFVSTYDLPGSQLYYRYGESRAVEQELIKRGYSANQAKRIAAGVKTVRGGEGVGEAAGILGVSAISETIGKKVATSVAKKQIQKAGVKTGTKAAAKISSKLSNSVMGSAVGGAYEGTLSPIIQADARDTNISKGQVALGAGLGMFSAAIGGGALNKIQRSGLPKSVKVAADWSQELVDPYEKPGDILAGIVSRTSKTSHPTPRVVTHTLTPTPAETPTETEGKTKKTASSTPSVVPTPVPTETPTETPISGFATATPIPTPDPTPTPVSPISSTATETPIPIDTPAETPTEVETPVPTPTGTPVTTATPMLRSLPPLPLNPGRPLGEESKVSRRGDLVYYDELARTKKLARRLFG